MSILRDTRLAVGVFQATLAEALGITQGYYSQMEVKAIVPKPMIAAKIIDYYRDLGVTNLTFEKIYNDYFEFGDDLDKKPPEIPYDEKCVVVKEVYDKKKFDNPEYDLEKETWKKS